MPTFNDARVRKARDGAINRAGGYVLYWCQMFRRLRANHALDYALHMARSLKKPLVVYEGLKLDSPWACARFHRFILEGMRDNLATAKRFGANYWPFVETPEHSGRGLVAKLCADACLLVTDDYPQFIVPAQIHAVASKVSIPVHAIDGNGMVPLSLLGPPTAAAAHLRPKLHKLFEEAWANRADAEPNFDPPVRKKVDPPFELWKPPNDLAKFVGSLPIDQSVPAVAGAEGGSEAAARQLAGFAKDRLPGYAEERNLPDDPAKGASSGLSWYLHYGHVGIQEVCEAVLGPKWTPEQLNPKTRNKDDFFCRDANANAFLDEAITWRDVGYQWHYARARKFDARIGTKSWQDDGEAVPSFSFVSFDFSPIQKGGTLDLVLPVWADNSLKAHRSDRREHVYSLEQFEAGETHDELWNAAQLELVATGRMHNYLRMLWGKKVLEWSETPERAYRVLEHLNNKYAIDGRDPNSYTGILWCFGLFDRPWPPERVVFGNVRYMSSANTAKKFKLDGYFRYVRRLRNEMADRAGQVG